MNRCFINLLALGAILSATGCAPSEKPNPQTEPVVPAAQLPRVFQVRGIVKELPKTGTRLRIQHEDIPDYMPAMTMPFSVKDRAELANIQVGDTVAFTFHVAETESWIDQIQPIKEVQNAPSPEQPVNTFRQLREIEPLELGDLLPNYPFINQENETVQLKDFKGKVLIFTFIYTRCPIPDYCPRMSLRFNTAYKTLKNDPQAPANWHFLTITFDPVFDTPEVLKDYAQAFSDNSKQWDFLTGKRIDIDALTEQFGMHFSRIRESVTDWDHNLRTIIVDPRGKIYKIYRGNTWTSETLIADIKDAAASETLAPAQE